MKVLFTLPLTLLLLLSLTCTPESDSTAPAPTPDLEATVQAAVSAALPTDTPTPPRRPTPIPRPTATSTPNPAASLSEMVRQARPAVVRIETYAGGGTGVIFDTQGQTAYVITNHHVVEGFSQINVVVNDSATYRGTVRGTDHVRGPGGGEYLLRQVPYLALRRCLSTRTG